MTRLFRKYISCFLFIFLPACAFAYDLKGTVTDADKKPLPFANVYVKGTTNGCATNEQGYYDLKLEPGKYIVVFQFIGYRKEEMPVEITNKNVTLNITLETDVRELKEVVISAKENDPAYRIIKKAILLRPDHLKENDLYACDVYIKGLQRLLQAPDKVLGVDVKTIVDVDSNNTGVIYLSESSSRFYFEYPDKTKEVMQASKVSGHDDKFSWNDARGMNMNFYENLVSVSDITERGFVSPIADNAMFFYDYMLLGTFQENNVTINKIRVIPKRQTDPVFTGEIYITDNDYRIYSTHLQLQKQNGLDFIDTFTVEQEYIPLENNRWAMISNKFILHYTFMKIKGSGYFNAFYRNYQFNPDLPPHFFDGELARVEEGANKKDTTYWNDTRPIPLTAEEFADYIQKDSLQEVKNTNEYKDSVDRKTNTFAFGDIMTGYHHQDSRHRMYIRTNPLFTLVQFNTVEGWVVNLVPEVTKKLQNDDELTVRPVLRYGFANHLFSPAGSITYKYDPFHSQYITVSGGIVMAQYNQNGIPPLINTVYTLLLEENYLKLYRKTYGKVEWSRELWNGFYLTLNSEYAHREQLFNTPSATPWINYPDKEFTGNNYPFLNDSVLVDIPDKFTAGVEIKYQIGQQYMSEPGKKYLMDPKWPELDFKYSKAFKGVFESNISYDYAELGINDKIKLGLQGNLQYLLQGGKFLTSDNLFIADEIQLSGNRTIFSVFAINNFFLLHYYFERPAHAYFEANFCYHTDGFLFNKIPPFRQLKWQPLFGVNYLTTNGDIQNYMEFTVGFEHIFKIGRIDLVYTPYDFDPDLNYNKHFRVIIGIGF